VCSLLPSLS
jgi:hypothetical protein